MTEFGGWTMPLVYSSILAEHMQVRRRCGVFDVSHMGRFVLRGSGATASLSRLLPTDISGLEVGQAAYSVFLNDQGGIRDDLIVYRLADSYLLIVNAGNREKDWEWINDGAASDTTALDRSDATCLLAVQGPRAFDVLERLGARLAAGAAVRTVPHFAYAPGTVAGRSVLFMRTGYTGEDGMEIMCERDDAEGLWDALLGVDTSGLVLPCGLGARDTLRLEAALPLHGHEIDETTTPYEARLGRIVHLEKGDFVGRGALAEAKARGPARLLVGMAAEGRSLMRHGDSIRHGDDHVGRVTSGTYSPVLGRPIALGYVPPSLAEVGTELAVESRGRLIEAVVVERPFYKRGVTLLPAES